MKEADLQRSIRSTLEETVGGFWFKVHGGLFQVAGLPDLIGVVDGLFIGIEVKVGKPVPSAEQATIIRLIKDAGGLAFTTNSVDVAVHRVKRWLKKNGKSIKNPSVLLSEESRPLSPKKRKSRVVHGAGNWKNDYRALRRRKALSKRRSK